MSKFYTNVVRYGNNILHRGYERGRRFQERVEFMPTLFVPSKTKSKWHSIDGKPMEPIQPGSIRDCKEFIDRYTDISNFEIHGNQNYHIQAIHEWYPEDIQYVPELIKVLFFDIEVHSDAIKGFPNIQNPQHEVVTIACYDSVAKDITVFGLKPYQAGDSETYYHCTSEKDLLIQFVTYLRERDFDIVTGWNIKMFDIPFLINRTRLVCGETVTKKYSPWGIISEKIIKIGSRENQTYDLYGLQQLDYLDLFKKFGYIFGQQESYRLDHIANVVLGERKLDYSDYGNLRNLYNDNSQLHTEYCVKDTMLVVRMDQKLAFLGTAYAMAYMMRVNYVDTFGTTAPWDSYMYGAYLKEHICVPPKKHFDGFGQVDGAYVKEPKPGVYDWVVSWDVASLYPSIIMQCNISPETIGDRLPNVTALGLLEKFPEIDENVCLTAAGQTFLKNKPGLLPRLVEGIFNHRKTVKKQMIEKQQLLHKIEEEISLRGKMYAD